VVVDSAIFLEDLRIVFVSEGFSRRDFDPIEVESLEPPTGFCLTPVDSLVDVFVEDSGTDFFDLVGNPAEVAEGMDFDFFEGVDSVAGGGSDLGACEVDFFVGAASDLFFFFPGSSPDSRARFFPFFTSSSISSGIGTRVKPSHLPPSSSSSLQLHIGKLALELVLICID